MSDWRPLDLDDIRPLSDGPGLDRIAELERQLAEALARAEFAEDQHEVALKDRDHAERERDEAWAALSEMFALEEMRGLLRMSDARDTRALADAYARRKKELWWRVRAALNPRGEHKKAP